MDINELIGLNCFGKVADGVLRMSYKSGIAVRTSNGYRVYDVNTGKLDNVTDLCMDLPGMFYTVPCKAYKPGDLIFFDGSMKAVVEVGKVSVKAFDYERSVIEEIVPETILFGHKKLYPKVISLMGDFAGLGDEGSDMSSLLTMGLLSKGMTGTPDAGLGGILPFLFMGKGKGKGFRKMLPFMALSQQQAGGQPVNPMLMMAMMNDDPLDLGGLFDGDDNDDEDEPHLRKPAKKARKVRRAPAPAPAAQE